MSENKKSPTKIAKKWIYDILLWGFIILIILICAKLLIFYFNNVQNIKINEIFECISNFLFNIKSILPTNKGDLGQFGDFIGGTLNPLIALAALLAVMRSISLQKTELAETRETLNDQAKTMRQQQENQQFFDLIGMLSRIINDYSTQKNLGKGGAIAIFNSTGIQNLSSKAATLTPENIQSVINSTKRYYNFVFHIITSINKYYDLKEHYLSIFKNSLSNGELNIILIHLIFERNVNHIEIVKNLNLLEHIIIINDMCLQQKDELPPECFGKT